MAKVAAGRLDAGTAATGATMRANDSRAPAPVLLSLLC